MKKIFKGLFIVLSFFMIMSGENNVVSGANAGEATTVAEGGQAAETENTTEQKEEPISDGKMILTMFLGMVCMAAVIVLFSAINYKKTKNSEKGPKRDIF